MIAFSMMVFPAVSPLSGQDCHECNLRLTFLRIYLPPPNRLRCVQATSIAKEI